VLSPEVVELVGSRCLLEPMGGGNARLLDLLDPYHLPPEVWRACAAMCSHLQAGRQCQCQLAGWLAGSAQPVPLGLAGLLPILEGSVRGTLYLGLDPACLPGWLQVQAEAAGATSLERAAKQVARERGALAALSEAAQGHALQVGGGGVGSQVQQRHLWLIIRFSSRHVSQCIGCLSHPCMVGRHCLPLMSVASGASTFRLLPCPLLPPLQLLRMHLLENVRVRVEAGHIDYVNELRWGQCSGGQA
jgi:hypothetical protein